MGEFVDLAAAKEAWSNAVTNEGCVRFTNRWGELLIAEIERLRAVAVPSSPAQPKEV